MYVAVKHTRT